MQPTDLHAKSFHSYPPMARQLATTHLQTLRQVQLSLLPVLLQEIRRYDWSFPAEQKEIARQLDYLHGLQPGPMKEQMAPFAAIQVPQPMAAMDWVNKPEAFMEQLTAMLWSTHQIDAYTRAAKAFQSSLDHARPLSPPAGPRWVVVVVGQGVAQTSLPLFQKLRPSGVLFTAVNPVGGLDTILDHLQARARQYPQTYDHWYIDGGIPQPDHGVQQGIVRTSYSQVVPAVMQELHSIRDYVSTHAKASPITAEDIRSHIMALTPQQLDLHGTTADAPLRHFEVSVITGGAGAQIFSTTFVQWAAREALSRAQPLTLVCRYAPRQQRASMEQMLNRDPLKQTTDPEGSPVDADMGAYYTWLNLQRLSGAQESRFLAWFEGHATALAIAPTLPKGVVSEKQTSLDHVLAWMS